MKKAFDSFHADRSPNPTVCADEVLPGKDVKWSAVMAFFNYSAFGNQPIQRPDDCRLRQRRRLLDLRAGISSIRAHRRDYFGFVGIQRQRLDERQSDSNRGVTDRKNRPSRRVTVAFVDPPNPGSGHFDQLQTMENHRDTRVPEGRIPSFEEIRFAQPIAKPAR